MEEAGVEKVPETVLESLVEPARTAERQLAAVRRWPQTAAESVQIEAPRRGRECCNNSPEWGAARMRHVCRELDLRMEVCVFVPVLAIE